MNARVFYEITLLNYGDNDDRNGHWLQRITVAYRNGKADHVLDRKPLAKFPRYDEAGQMSAFEVRTINEAVKDGTFRFLPEGWNLPMIDKL